MHLCHHIYSLLKKGSLCTTLGEIKAKVDYVWKGTRTKVWTQRRLRYMLALLCELPSGPLIKRENILLSGMYDVETELYSLTASGERALSIDDFSLPLPVPPALSKRPDIDAFFVSTRARVIMFMSSCSTRARVSSCSFHRVHVHLLVCSCPGAALPARDRRRV